jgi:hypothetical protein
MANLDPKASLPSTECNVDRQRSEKNPEKPLDPKISMPSTDCDADHQRSEKNPERVPPSSVKRAQLHPYSLSPSSLFV